MAEVAVLGTGAWGLALADYLARHGNNVRVWGRNRMVVNALRRDRSINRPAGLVLASGVELFESITEAVEGASVILSVVPSFATAEMCHALVPCRWGGSGAVFVNCSKGIEPETQRLPWEIFRQVAGDREDLRYATLAGPSHAEEVWRGVPTAVVASAPRLADAKMLQSLFSSPTFRVYTQADTNAVELGGALKNVIAIAAGVCDGKGFGDNTKAALITRGVAEIARMAVATGSSAETVAGLSGLGDLIVTAMSQHSRNRRFGELLASGCGPEKALEDIGAVVEGYRTAKSAWTLSVRYGLDMPLVRTVHDVLYRELDIDAGIAILLDRDASMEDLR